MSITQPGSLDDGAQSVLVAFNPDASGVADVSLNDSFLPLRASHGGAGALGKWAAAARTADAERQVRNRVLVGTLLAAGCVFVFLPSLKSCVLGGGVFGLGFLRVVVQEFEQFEQLAVRSITM